MSNALKIQTEFFLSYDEDTAGQGVYLSVRQHAHTDLDENWNSEWFFAPNIQFNFTLADAERLAANLYKLVAEAQGSDKVTVHDSGDSNSRL